MRIELDILGFSDENIHWDMGYNGNSWDYTPSIYGITMGIV